MRIDHKNRCTVQLDPTASVTLRAALGELEAMALPMMCGVIDRSDIAVGPIEKADNFNAQGLEGALIVRTNWGKAFVLTARMAANRWRIVA